jgi:hypothetical protein
MVLIKCRLGFSRFFSYFQYIIAYVYFLFQLLADPAPTARYGLPGGHGYGHSYPFG